MSILQALGATAAPLVWDPDRPLCPSNQPDACGVCTLQIETQEALHQPGGCGHVFHRDCFDTAREHVPADVLCPSCWENGKFLHGCPTAAFDAKMEEESAAETVVSTIACEPPAPETIAPEPPTPTTPSYHPAGI